MATGTHCIADAVYDGPDPGPESCEHWFREAADRLGITILGVHSYLLPVTDDIQGITSVAAIAESHMALHSWPEYKVLQLDVASCKPFDAGIVWAFFVEYFGVEEFLIWHVLDRWRPVTVELDR